MLKVAGRGDDPGIQHEHGVLFLSVVFGSARARKPVRRNGVSRLKLQHTSSGKRWRDCAAQSKNLNRVRSNSVCILKANFEFESDDRTKWHNFQGAPSTRCVKKQKQKVCYATCQGGGLLRHRGVRSRRGADSCGVVFFCVLIVYTHPKDVVRLNVEHDDNRQTW